MIKGARTRSLITEVAKVTSIVLIIAFAGGCTFKTIDLRRPITLDEKDIPHKVNHTSPIAEYYDEIKLKNLNESLKSVRTAVDYFHIHQYSESYSDVAIDSLVQTIPKFSENPYTWVMLGAYLYLEQFPRAAITATNKAIIEIQKIKNEDSDAFETFKELYITALLNLSIYHISVENYSESLLAIETIGNPKNLNAFHRLCYYFQKVLTYTGLHDIHQARIALNYSTYISGPNLLSNFPIKTQLNYPQYFNLEIRKANLFYLKGLIFLEEKDSLNAELNFKKAIERNQKLWEAHYNLANAYYIGGKKREAEAKLKWLIGMNTASEFYREEFLHFNLGNIFLSQKKYDEAINSYLKSIKKTKRRAKNFQKKIKWRGWNKIPELQVVMAQSIYEDEKIFPNALNNLGNAYFESWINKVDGLTDTDLPFKAEESYKEALKSKFNKTAFITYANLGRLYWHMGKYDDFFTCLAKSLSIETDYFYGIEMLLKLSHKIENIQDASKGYTIGFDTLLSSINRESFKNYLENNIKRIRLKLESYNNECHASWALGRLYFLSRDYEKNSELYKQSIKLCPGVVWPLIGLARVEIEKKNGNFKKAENMLTTGIAGIDIENQSAWTAPDYRDAFFLRALARARQNNFKGAKEDLEKVLKISPRWNPAIIGIKNIENIIQNQDKVE